MFISNILECNLDNHTKVHTEVNANIFVVGATGVGKSTLSNFLVDPYTDHKEKETDSKFETSNSLTSCTQKINSIEFTFENLTGLSQQQLSYTNVRIIDTPGINEKDPLVDLQHVYNFYRSVSDFNAVNAILLVFPYSSRIDKTVKNTFDYYLAVFTHLPLNYFKIVFTKFSEFEEIIEDEYIDDWLLQREREIREKLGIEAAIDVYLLDAKIRPTKKKKVFNKYFEHVESLKVMDRFNGITNKSVYSLLVRNNLLEKCISNQQNSMLSNKIPIPPNVNLVRLKIIAKLNEQLLAIYQDNDQEDFGSITQAISDLNREIEKLSNSYKTIIDEQITQLKGKFEQTYNYKLFHSNIYGGGKFLVSGVSLSNNKLSFDYELCSGLFTKFKYFFSGKQPVLSVKILALGSEVYEPEIAILTRKLAGKEGQLKKLCTQSNLPESTVEGLLKKIQFLKKAFISIEEFEPLYDALKYDEDLRVSSDYK